MNIFKIRKTKIKLEELNYLTHIDSMISDKLKYYTSYGNGGNRLELEKEYNNNIYIFKVSFDSSNSYLNFYINDIYFEKFLSQNKNKYEEMMIKILPEVIDIFIYDIKQAADYYLNNNEDIVFFLPYKKYTPNWKDERFYNNRLSLETFYNFYDFLCDSTIFLKNTSINIIFIYAIYWCYTTIQSLI